jgi:hypothetical protein
VSRWVDVSKGTFAHGYVRYLASLGTALMPNEDLERVSSECTCECRGAIMWIHYVAELE